MNESNATEKVLTVTIPRIISAVWIVLMIILALAGNFLVCIVFGKYKELRTVTNYYISSLAAADVMVALLTMPFWLAYIISLSPIYEEESFMKTWICLDMVFSISSIGHLSAISVDRYFSCFAPITHRSCMTINKVRIVILGIWLYAVVNATFFLLSWQWKYVLIMATGFLLPLTVMVASYLSILVIVHRNSSQASNKARRRRRHARQLKRIRTLGIVLGCFVATWLPFFILTMLYEYCRSCIPFLDRYRNTLPYFIKTIHYMNSCINPIIYAFYSPSFRKAIDNLCHKKKRKRDSIRFTTIGSNGGSLTSAPAGHGRKRSLPASYHHFI